MVDFFHFQRYISIIFHGKGHLQLDQSSGQCASNFRKSLFFVALTGGAFFGASEGYSLTSGIFTGGWNFSFWPVVALWGAGIATGALFTRRIPAGQLICPGLLALELLLLIQPGSPWRSAVAAVLTGGFLCSLPAGSGLLCRMACGAGFAAGLAVDVLCFRGGGAPGLLLLPVLLLAVICVLPLRGLWRILAIFLLPAAVFLASSIYSVRSFQLELRDLRNVSIAPALPASLMPAEGEGMFFLFVSDLHSPLPAVWAALPYVSSVDCVWPRAAARFGDASLKVNSYEGHPGRILPLLTRRYELIYLENLPPVSAAALRTFVEAALERLEPKRGVLVLPAAFRGALPAGLHVAELPGGEGRFLAASHDAGLTADLGVLDRRLQGYQRVFGENNLFMPAGIFAALYAATGGGRPESSVSPDRPEGFRLPTGLPRSLLWVLPVAWLALRILCGRSGEGRARVLLTENSASFALVLLAAWQGYDRRELFTGIPALLLPAAAGVLLFDSVLRPRVERWFVGFASLLPFVLLLPWRFFLFEPGYLLVAVCSALGSGMVRTRIAAGPESKLAPPETVFWSGVGLLAGALLFELVGILLPGVPAAPLVAALLLRIGWFFP